MLIGAIAVLIAVAVILLSGGKAELPGVVQPEPEPEPEKVRVEGRYLFTGSTAWGRHMLTWSTREDGTMDYAYPFSGLHTFERDKYDAWMTELECSTVEDGIPLEQQIDEIIFNCPPEFLPEAAKYFDFISLANNHSFDMGQEGLDETRRQLVEHGMHPFGDFEPADRDNACEVVGLPVRIISEQNGEESSEDAHLPIAMCAWHYFFRMPSPGEVEAMREYAEVMPVFAFVHAGVEYEPEADEVQMSIARQVADQGPEFVVANNPHWVQNGEVYNDTLILYSTGNFIFDQQWHDELMRSASLDVDMFIPYTDELQRWLDLGDACQEYKNDCLEQIQQGDFERPELSLTYDIVAGENTEQITRRGDSALQQAIEQRVGWRDILTALGQE